MEYEDAKSEIESDLATFKRENEDTIKKEKGLDEVEKYLEKRLNGTKTKCNM